MSYQYVSKSEIKVLHSFCSSKMNELVQVLRKQEITCKFYGIGSYAKNMVTKNGKAPYDLDYNIEITKQLPPKYNDLKKLKNLIRSKMDGLLPKPKFSCGKDSTSVITYIQHIPNNPNIQFTFDIGIVSRNNNGNLQRLIHNKKNGTVTWNEAKNSNDIDDKVKTLRKNGYTNEIKELYLKKKNDYLSKNDSDNHPSFIVYIETINEIYEKSLKNKRKNKTASSEEQGKKTTLLMKVKKNNAYMYFLLFEQNGWIKKEQFVFKLITNNGTANWCCSSSKSKIESPEMKNKKEARNFVAYKILKNLKE